MSIQIRRGTTTEWQSSNEVLKAGQPVVAFDDANDDTILKIGDGEHTYSQLPRIGTKSSNILSGVEYPDNSIGSDGDLYFMYS